MKIKEVEELVGLARSNIRYYERQGLLHPERDQENSYREYTEEDIERILQIKTLRMLGLTIADIRQIYAKEVTLSEVMQARKKQILEEEKELAEIRKICDEFIENDIQIDTWDGKIQESDKKFWKERLDEVFDQDRIFEPITKIQLNKRIAKMLMWGYLINIPFTILIWSFFTDYQGLTGNGIPGRYANIIGQSGMDKYSIHHSRLALILIGCCAVQIICNVIFFITEKVKWQMLAFHISSLNLSPILIGLIKFYEDFHLVYCGLYISDGGDGIFAMQAYSIYEACVFWALLILYVLIIYFISLKWKKMFTKMRYSLVITLIIWIIYAVVIYLFVEHWIPAVGVCGIMLFYIAVSWTTFNIDKEKYNRFDSITTPGRIISPLAAFLRI